MRMPGSVCAAGLLFSVLVATSSRGAEPTLLDSQLDAFESLLNEQADAFAGLTVDPERRRVFVRRAGSQDSKWVRELVAKLPPSPAAADDRTWTIVTTTVTRSNRALNLVRKQLLTKEPLASLLKPVLAGHHIDIERNVVAVGVTAISDELFEEAKRTFGSAIELYVTDKARAFSRSNWVDTGFLAGGTRLAIQINGTNERGTCTSGFSVRPTDSSVLRGFLTAGHCFYISNIFSAIWDQAGNFVAPSFVWRAGPRFQESGSSIWPEGADAALVLDSLPSQTFVAHPSIYTTATTRRFVIGTRTARVGDLVCFGGSITGENCNARVIAVGRNRVPLVVPTDFGPVAVFFDNITEVQSTNGSVIAQGGDSGGPVYVKSLIGLNTVVRAVGSIEGGIENGRGDVAFFIPMSAMLPLGWQLWAASCRLTFFGSLSCSTQ